MSRVHCLECDGLVVVDPSGVCPEGHQLGPPGARVAGAMGHATAHPDEPEPWVYRIEPHELAVPVGAGVTGAESNGNGPRVARPMSAPGFDPFEDTAEVGDAESLLRELHSLAAFDDAPAPRPQQGGSRHDTEEDATGAAPPSPPPAPPSHTPRPQRPDPDAMADAFAELSALDAPAAPMTARARSAPASGHNGVASSANGRSGTSQQNGSEPEMDPDELASLFDTPPPTPTASGRPNLTAVPAPPATPPEPDPTEPETAPLDTTAPMVPPPLYDHHQEPPMSAIPTDDQPEDVGDLDMDLAELARELSFGGDELPFGGPATDAAPAPGSEPSPPSSTTQPTPAPPAPPEFEPASPSNALGTEPEHDLQQPDPTRNAGPDLTSFTAKGGSSSRSGKRRRFGR